MKKYFRTVFVLGFIYLIVVVLAFFVLSRIDDLSVEADNDIVILNDITHDVSKYINDIKQLENKDYGVDFCVIDTIDETIFSSNDEDEKYETMTVEKAIKNGYPYQCIVINNRLKGYVILVDNGNGVAAKAGFVFLSVSLSLGIALVIIAVVYGLFVKKRIITPFQSMKSFAGKVAEGNLDESLYMDKDNMFGAFTESFDIMRDELKASRKREIASRKREQELVASLSHDLKTPITGIKLTCEVLQAKMSVEDERAKKDTKEAEDKKSENCINGISSIDELKTKIDNIYNKAEQIEVLINDLLSTTLEDLGEFKVACSDLSSSILGDIVTSYDDKNLVSSYEVPEVLICVDKKRIAQVIGNVIANSYKYADTRIDVSFELEEKYLQMSIADYGPGVPEDELNLITNKFYRGKQWIDSGEEGNGLGLYIARILMEKMDGELTAANTDDGFCITLTIPLS